MKFFQSYLLNILRYDLIRRFNYSSIKDIAYLKNVVLCFKYRNPSYNQLLNSLIALELISNSKAKFITSKKPNVSLRIRAGSPVGCKVILTNHKMLNFLSNLLLFIIPKDKIFKGASINKRSNNSVNFEFKSLYLFRELSDHYNILKDLTDLSIVVNTNSKTFSELLFLIRLLKLKCLK